MNEGIVKIINIVTQEIKMQHQLFIAVELYHGIRQVPSFLVELDGFNPFIKNMIGQHSFCNAFLIQSESISEKRQ
jgi:hypothetical protein